MEVKTLKALLSKRDLSSADKSEIKRAYQEHIGVRLFVKKGCPNCYADALAEIYASISRGARLKAGEVVAYEGRFYNRHDYPLPEYILQNFPDKIQKI